MKTIIDAIFEKGWKITDYPDKILNKRFPDHRGTGAQWQIIANGNKEPRKVEPDQWGEMELPPFHFAVFWNGWLAGLLSPTPDGNFGGSLAANPNGADEENLILSIEANG